MCVCGGGGGACVCAYVLVLLCVFAQCLCVCVCVCARARACVCAHFCAQFRYEKQMIGLPFVHSPRLRLDSLRTFLANLEAEPSVS